MTRVLLVDDQPITREVTAEVLQEQGYQVLLASESEEALAVARDERPDVAIIDVQMPGVNGPELVRALRSESGLEDLRILLYSIAIEDEIAWRKAGADAYLTKGAGSVRELTALIERLTGG